jgi:DNA gyrase subunit B
LVPAAGAEPLTRDALEALAQEYLLSEAVVDRLSKVIDKAVLFALLKSPQIDLSEINKARASAEHLAKALNDDAVALTAEYIDATESCRILIPHLSLKQTSHRAG